MPCHYHSQLAAILGYRRWNSITSILFHLYILKTWENVNLPKIQRLIKLLRILFFQWCVLIVIYYDLVFNQQNRRRSSKVGRLCLDRHEHVSCPESPFHSEWRNTQENLYSGSIQSFLFKTPFSTSLAPTLLFANILWKPWPQYWPWQSLWADLVNGTFVNCYTGYSLEFTSRG